MGGEFVGLTHLQTPYDHILVALDETTVVDVGGARTPDDVLAAGGKLVPVSQADLDDLSKHDWMPARPDIAATFVPAVIAHVDAGEPHRKPRCFSRNIVLGDFLEIHVEWSTADTGDRLTAFGRLPGDRHGRWTRCAVMSIKADKRDERVIDFTAEAFADHSDRFLAQLRAMPTRIVANVVAAENPERPLCPP
jgi:hypothetical protein